MALEKEARSGFRAGLLLYNRIMRTLRRSEWTLLIIVAVMIVLGIFVYPALPEQTASHWNAAGEVNGYLPRFWGAFLLPIIALIIALLFIAIPRVDPKRANIEGFRSYFDRAVILLLLFFFYLYGLTLFWNVGYHPNFAQWLAPAFGILFYYLGVLSTHTKMNWFIGIRTPWTLSSERVWDKTHALGGKLFRAAGAIALFGLVFPAYGIWFMLVPVLVAAVWAVAYSYVEYRREERSRA